MIQAPEELVPRGRARRPVLTGVIKGLVPPQQGETWYQVEVQHPVSGMPILLPRVRAATPRFYPSDGEQWSIGAAVLVRQQSRTTWELIGAQAAPGEWTVTEPGMILQQGNSRLQMQTHEDSWSRAEQALVLSDEHIILEGEQARVQVGDEQVILAGAGAGLRVADNGHHFVIFNPGHRSDFSPKMLVAWPGGPRFIRGQTDIAAPGNTGTADGHQHSIPDHSHIIAQSIPYRAVLGLRADAGELAPLDWSLTDSTRPWSPSNLWQVNPRDDSVNINILMTPPSGLGYTQAEVGGVPVGQYTWAAGSASDPPVAPEDHQYEVQGFRYVLSAPQAAFEPEGYTYLLARLGNVLTYRELLRNSLLDQLGLFLEGGAEVTPGGLVAPRAALFSNVEALVGLGEDLLEVPAGITAYPDVTPALGATGRNIIDLSRNRPVAYDASLVEQVLYAGFRVRIGDAELRAFPSAWSAPAGFVSIQLKDGYRFVEP